MEKKEKRTQAALEHSNLKMLGVMWKNHKEKLRSGQQEQILENVGSWMLTKESVSR